VTSVPPRRPAVSHNPADRAPEGPARGRRPRQGGSRSGRPGQPACAGRAGRLRRRFPSTGAGRGISPVHNCARSQARPTRGSGSAPAGPRRLLRRPGARPLRALPASWVRSYGAGRVLCSTLGHRPEVLDEPSAATLTTRGLRWAARAL